MHRHNVVDADVPGLELHRDRAFGVKSVVRVGDLSDKRAPCVAMVEQADLVRPGDDEQAPVPGVGVIQRDPAGDQVEVGVGEERVVLVPPDLGAPPARFHVQLRMVKLHFRPEECANDLENAIARGDRGEAAILHDRVIDPVDPRRLGRVARRDVEHRIPAGGHVPRPLEHLVGDSAQPVERGRRESVRQRRRKCSSTIRS